MIRFTFILWGISALALAGCANGPGGPSAGAPTQAQGRYVYPEYLRPQPVPVTPQADACGARVYYGLIGQHIGGVHIGALQGRKRIIRPADVGMDEVEFLPDMQIQPPFLTVTELLPGQPVYAASVRTGVTPGELGPDDPSRLTLELDNEGYIYTIGCR